MKIENPEKEYLYDSVYLLYSTQEGFDKYGFALYKEHCNHYVIDEYATPLNEPETLLQIETWFINRFNKILPCMVITERGLCGKVYRYGNYGDYWEQVGETCGYA